MPLTIRTLADLISGLQDQVPEKSRILIYQRISNLITNALKESDSLKHWLEIGKLRFARECNLIEPWFPDDLKIEPTELTKFCNKWMSISSFKMPEEDDSKYRPITIEMNSLRVTMVKELIALCKLITKK